MHENEETYQEKKNLMNLEETLRKRFKVRERSFGRGIGTDKSREIEKVRIELR